MLNAMNNKGFYFKVIILSLSVFVISSVFFSRLVIKSFKNSTKNVVQKDSISEQVLSYREGSLDDADIDDVKILPENFPSDIPIFPNSTLEDLWASESLDISGISVLWITQDDYLDVVDFYKTGFVGNDWQNEIILESENSFTMSFNKIGIDGFIGITGEESGNVLISVTVGLK